MRKIVANWKMYLTLQESRELSALLREWLKKQPCEGVELIVCPSYLAMHDVRQQLGDANVRLALQDIAISPDLGAFTGQQSAQQAVELGISHALMGHSEMRQFYHVTDDQVASQCRTALSHGLSPIICIGETKEERDAGLTEKVITEQLHAICSGLDSAKSEILIAYEPRWAIGTGKPLDPKEADIIAHLMKETLNDLSLPSASVLYGGSVSSENMALFLNDTSYNGFLIGSASASADRLTTILDVLATSICE